MLRTLLALSLVFSITAPATAQLDTAGGGTVVSVEGSTIKITVNVDVPVWVPDEGLLEHVRAYVEPGFAAAAKFWNDALADRFANECFTVEISVVPNFVEFGESTAGGGHDVLVSHDFNGRFDSPQLTTETTNDDTAEVFTTNGTAYLPPWMFQVEPRDLAHELGHMFGLGDDYTRDAEGNPVTLPGREGTLMDGGDEVDQALVDRIADLVKRSGKQLPQCWKGTANVASSAVYPGGSVTCQDGWDLEFTFVTSAEGTIDGQGTAELVSGPTCPFPIGPSLTQYQYQVLGEETAGGFSIRFALETFGPEGGAEYAGFMSMFGVPAPTSGGPPVVVAVSGTSGTGQGTWQFRSGNPPATYSANGTIEVECLTCEEAVG